MADKQARAKHPGPDESVLDYVSKLTQRPGVYRMLDAADKVIYVGKARNLKRRVASYFSGRAHNAKTIALVERVSRVEVTITRTEAEALMLEYNLIKEHKPRYNILLRDDKSYPYIRLSADVDFPRLSFYRGSRKIKGTLFGPFPSAGAVRETLSQLQKLFRIRNCEDSVFRNRSRPCLQHQIGRCTAPCVGEISAKEYREDIDSARLFLTGHNDAVIERLAEAMERSAESQEYERAAQFRDRLKALKGIQASQLVTRGDGDLDVVNIATTGGTTCVSVLFFRSGRSLGTRNFFPRHGDYADEDEILRAFMLQYYAEREAPAEIITATEVWDAGVIEEMLSERAGRRVRIRHRVRGDRARLLELAQSNARTAAEQRGIARMTVAQQFADLADALGLDTVPTRIECFDISHTSGNETVGACVAFDQNGPLKSAYRRYNVRSVDGGDDYGALREVLTRRYSRSVAGESPLPEVVLIDGGRGQLRQAVDVFNSLELSGPALVGVSKGTGRKSGRESLHRPGETKPVRLPASSSALTLILQLRDESHRFALTGHRGRREKRMRQSALDDIAGLGPKRRQALMRQFGGLQGIAQAAPDDLSRVNGISAALAQRIYDRFHAS